MKTRTIYEEEVLKEIQGLPETAQQKLVKVFRFLRNEIIPPNLDEKSATDEFLSVCGKWEDERSTDEQLKDIYSSRKSTSRTEKIF